MSSDDFSVPQAVLIFRQFLTEVTKVGTPTDSEQLTAAILTAGVVIGKAFNVNDDASLKQHEKELSFANTPEQFCSHTPQEGKALITLDIIQEKGVLITQEAEDSNCSATPVNFGGEETIQASISAVKEMLAKGYIVDFLYKPKFKTVGLKVAETYKEDELVFCSMIP